MAKPFFYGGQAVLEGVMMRGQRHMAVAVRDADGQIVLHEEPLHARIYSGRAVKWPFVRGVAMIWDMLGLGLRAMKFAANVQLKQQAVEVSSGGFGLILGLSLALAVAIFFITPLLLAGWFEAQTGTGMVTTLVEGVVRIALLLGYIRAIAFLPDIRRVFAYHGAEHKTINALEAGVPLEPATIARYSVANPRCGTGFLLIVMVLAVAVFSLADAALAAALQDRLPIFARLPSRILLVPLIAAVAYEVMRWGAAHMRNRFVRAIFRPTLALQSLTTREPDEDQIAVAVAALQAVLAADGVPAPAEPELAAAAPVPVPA
jgi:uncharacterized protein YqhQ